MTTLLEMALKYNLDQELLREVVEEDLSIALPDGMDTGLDDKTQRRILACDGLETVDGEEFAPIIDDSYKEKHKRSLAAKKAAETRRRKEEDVGDQKPVIVIVFVKLLLTLFDHYDLIIRYGPVSRLSVFKKSCNLHINYSN